MSGQRPIVVTAVNDSYAEASATMLLSLALNLVPDASVDVHVLYLSLSSDSKSLIERAACHDRIRISFKKIDQTRINDLKVSGHISIDTYSRLLIADTLSEFEKVIYLDADLIVQSSICELWHMPLDGKHLAAVPLSLPESAYMGGSRGVPSHRHLGIPARTRTFNAGVMVLDLALWRRDMIAEEVLDYLREFARSVLWWDQDGLNAILYQRWQALHPVWNVMSNHLGSMSSPEDSTLSAEEFNLVRDSPKIVHYAGPEKPWQAGYRGLFYETFLNYHCALFGSPIERPSRIRPIPQ